MKIPALLTAIAMNLKKLGAAALFVIRVIFQNSATQSVQTIA